MNATTRPAPTSRPARAIISGSPEVPVFAIDPPPPAGAGLAGGADDGGVEAGGELGDGVAVGVGVGDGVSFGMYTPASIV